MNAARHQRVSDIFLAAARMERGRRADLLNSRCGDDFELRREVESLLSHHEASSMPIETPALGDDFRLVELHVGHPRSTRRPARIGRYRVLDVLGEGGMGVVYLAEQDNPRRTVALKVIRPEVMSWRALKRFDDEAQILGRLQHPGIAQILEAGAAAIDSSLGARPQPYFAMEYVRGQPLLAFAASRRLPTTERLRLFAQICASVQHAHDKGIVHRDLKPSNILVDEHSQPKILDFGVARCTDSDVHATTLRSDIGQLIGTISYMSPEQAAGDSSRLDARSDVYALGVICYELLTGRLPHDLRGKTIPEAVRIIGQDDPAPLSAIHPVFRGDLNTMVAKSLEKDRTRRYQSAGDFSLDVERYLDNQPIAARPSSALYHLRKFAQRNRALVGGIAAVFVVLVAGLIGSGASLLRALDAEATAVERLEHAQRETRKAKAFSDFLYHILTRRDVDGVEGRDITLLTQRLDAASIEVKTVLANLPEVRAAVQQTIGEAYQALGLYDQAEILLEESLAERQRIFGRDHLDVAEGHFVLAAMLRDRGDHRAAEPAFRKALEIRTAHLGPDHPDVLTSMNELALCLVEDDDGTRLREAAALCRGALEARRRLYPEQRDAIARNLLTLSVVLRNEGDLEGAEAALRENLEIVRALYGDADSRVAGVLLNLGTTLWRQGRLEAAEQYLRQGLDIRRAAVGNQHTALTWGALQLARLLSQQGRVEEAEALCRESIAIRVERLGENHGQVIDALQVLMDVLAAAGRRDEARAVGEDVLMRMRREHGGQRHDLADWAEKVKALGAAGLLNPDRRPVASSAPSGVARDGFA